MLRYSLHLSIVVVCITFPWRSQASADNSPDRSCERARPVVPEFAVRSAFATDADYAKYVENTLQVSWRVRATADYGKVQKGMTGTYYGTGGNPPCCVVWDLDLQSGSTILPNIPPEKATSIYWVPWQDVAIIGPKR